MMITCVFLLLALLATGGFAANNCKSALCVDDGEETLISCNSNTLDSICDTPVLVNFTDKLQTLVVTTHNGYRNIVASGSTPLMDAVRMATVSWDSELERVAEYNVKLCAPKLNECRNTDLLSHASLVRTTSNFGYVSTTSDLTAAKIESYIKRIQDNWYGELNSITQDSLDSYPDDTTGNVIGHFSAMMQQHSANIGCAAVTYKRLSGTTKVNVVLLACEYSCKNIFGSPIYTKGPVASKCKTGRDSVYTSLCSTAEEILPSLSCL